MFTRLATAALTALALLVGGAAAASASTATHSTASAFPSESATAHFRKAFAAEQASNRACGLPEDMGAALSSKWERCVTRQYKHRTGTRMDVLGTACKHSRCGLLADQATMLLPSRKAVGADTVKPVSTDEQIRMGVPQSAYDRVQCRRYSFADADRIACSNGTVLLP